MTGALPDRSLHADAPLYDVNADGFLSLIDVLLVINGLNEDVIAPQVTVSLQYDSAPNGVSDDDSITRAGVVSGSAIDDLTGIGSVQFSVNDGPFQSLDFAADGSFSSQPTLADGVQTISVRAVDGRNMASPAVPLEFTFDSEAPTITLDTSGPFVTNADLTITGQVSDALAGVESLLAQLDLADTVEVPVNGDGTFSFTTSL